MIQQKRQQINITKKDADIIPFLEQKPNISQYVIGLIRKDMLEDKKDFKESVINVIKDYCNNDCRSENKQENCFDAIKNVFEL